VNEGIALVRPLDTGRTIEVEATGVFWAAIEPDELRDASRNVLQNAVRYAYPMRKSSEQAKLHLLNCVPP
jgi:hypothetical protein